MAGSLIIGGAGFVGSHLSKALIGRGERPVAVVKPTTNTSLLQALAPNAEIRRIAPDDLAALAELFDEKQPEIVYYVAANPRATGATIFDEVDQHLKPALMQLLTALRAASEAKFPPRAFVRTGTLAEYGDAPTPHSEEMRGIPSTIYGVSALAGTRVLEVVDKALPFRVANARLALVYGWGQSKKFLVPLMIDSFLRGDEVTINDPDAVRDLIHVEDVCEALIALGQTPNETPGPINIGSGEALSMREAAEIILEAAGAPMNLVRYGDPSLTTGSRRLEVTTGRAAQLIGWRAKTPFRDGARALVEKSRREGAAQG
ncbi:MAG TPA: hypothetical protein DEA40_14505 [Parvularcula sp.]|nr:hypothetical protein [Parvularcula sp.]